MTECIFNVQFSKTSPLTADEAKVEKQLLESFLADVPTTIPGRDGEWNVMSRNLTHHLDQGYSEITFTGELRQAARSRTQDRGID